MTIIISLVDRHKGVAVSKDATTKKGIYYAKS